MILNHLIHFKWKVAPVEETQASLLSITGQLGSIMMNKSHPVSTPGLTPRLPASSMRVSTASDEWKLGTRSELQAGPSLFSRKTCPCPTPKWLHNGVDRKQTCSKSSSQIYSLLMASSLSANSKKLQPLPLKRSTNVSFQIRAPLMSIKISKRVLTYNIFV